MDIVLINSPLFRKNKLPSNEVFLPPLGLGYIASNLGLNNIETEIIDSVSQNISLHKLENILLERRPKFIGINIFTTNYEIVKELIESLDFETHIIIGGLSTKSLFQKILQWDTKNQIDIVIGDGELITVGIIKNNIKEETYYESHNRRVFLIDDKSVYFVKDISNMPLNRDFFLNEPFPNHLGVKEANLVTSRGCIYNCSFCAAARSLNKGYPVRERSTNSIIEELQEIKIKYPETESVRILDDLFLKSKDSIIRAIDIFSGFDFQWRSMAHVKTFNQVGLDLLEGMKESGCQELFIGIESGSPNILRSINKTYDIELILENFKKIFQAKIGVKGYFICGFPDELVNDLKLTYKLACELKKLSLKYGSNFRTSVFQFRPYHGTILYNALKEKYPDLEIDNISPNNKLSDLIGRRQFNFRSNNYSKVSLKTIHDYICMTNMV